MIVTDTKYYSTLTQKQYETAKEGNAAETEYIVQALRDFNNTHKIKWYRQTAEDIGSGMSHSSIYDVILLLTGYVKMLEIDNIVDYWQDMFMSRLHWEKFCKVIANNNSVTIVNAWMIPKDLELEELSDLYTLLKAIDPTSSALFPSDWFGRNRGLIIHLMETRRGTADAIAGTNIVLVHMDDVLRRISTKAEALAILGLV
ncbi:MAG: hypothetical protein K2F99_02735 [Muribaculaceae bacterium]|nr:hypothetical protein [Muribaculaceae bacterium]